MKGKPTSGFARIVTSAQILIDVTKAPPDDWAEGPLNAEWRKKAGKPVDGSVAGRLPYINSGLEQVLYRRDDVGSIRWHKLAPEAPTNWRGAQLDAIELLRMPFRKPFPNGLLTLHFTLDTAGDTAEILRTLNHLTNHNQRHESGIRDSLADLLSPWAKLSDRHRRAQHVTLLTRSSDVWDASNRLSSSTSSPDMEWLFALAMCGRYRPDPSSISEDAIKTPEVQNIWMSDKLRGAVSRDAFVMIGLQKDDGGTEGEFGFDYDGAQFFAQGLYSDVLALSAMQRVALDALEADLASMYRRQPSPAELLALESELSDFRTMLWRKDFAPQGSQDEVLEKLQNLQRLREREADLSRNISEVSARTSRLEQGVIATLLRLLTVIGVVWGFVWTLLTELDVAWRLCALYVAFSIVLIVLLFHPGIQAALGIRERRSATPTHVELHSQRVFPRDERL